MKDVSFIEIWLTLQSAVLWLTKSLIRLWQLNPLSFIQRRQKQLYSIDSPDIAPSFQERVAGFFQSDKQRQIKLLKWVQANLTKFSVVDFTTSWQDGITLCALLEQVSNGACPRFDLLKPHHRVNNCRLGIKLTQRFLGLKKMSITPEEMAIADEDTGQKIIHMVQMIKWKSNTTKNNGSCSALIINPTQSMANKLLGEVTARGTGLKKGIVGRKAKFHILTTIGPIMNLHIDVRGPNNEMNGEKIVSVVSGVRLSGLNEDQTDSQHVLKTSDSHRTKYIKDTLGNVFVRQKTLEEDVQDVIPFDCQCVGEGRFQVTYIPSSVGIYVINIKSECRNIEGSPFEVKVNDWSGSWNRVSTVKHVPFDMLSAIDESQSQRNRQRVHKTNSDRHNSKNSISKIAGVSKQLTIMRRRVLKRIITRNGEEIVLHDASVSPTLSRQSSADVSDISEDEGTKRLSPLDLTQGSATDHGSQTRMASLLPRPIDSLSLNSNQEGGRPKTDSPPQKRRLRPLTPCRTEVIYTDEAGIERRDTEGSDSPDYPEPKYKIIIDDLHATPKMDLNRSLVDDITEDTADDFKFPQTPPSYETRDPIDSADEETCAEDDLNDVKDNNDEDDVFTWDIPNPKLPAKRTMSDDVIQRSPGHSFFKSKSVIDDHSRNVHSSKITTLKSSSLQKACFYISDKAFSQSFNSTSETDNSDLPASNFSSLDISRPGSINSDNTDDVSDHQGADLELTEINSTTQSATGSSDSGETGAAESGSNDENENCVRKPSTCNTSSKQRRSNLLRQATLHYSPTLSGNVSASMTDSPEESSCDQEGSVRLRIKVDKSTQVKYDEIKAETGWNSRIYTLRRRNLDNSSEIFTATTGSNENTNRKLAALQQLLMNSHHSFFRPVFADTTDFGRAMHQNELPIGNRENPSLGTGENRSRQSTVETIDSGIDDSHREIGAAGVINGHRRLSRHTYPWEINLDPEMTKGSSCSSMSPDEGEGRFRLSKYLHATVNRNIQHILSQGSDTDSPEVVFSSPGITEEGSLSDSEVACLNSYARRRIFKHQRMRRQISSNSSSGSVKAVDNLGTNIFLRGKRFKFRTLTGSDEDSEMSRKLSDQQSAKQNNRISTVTSGEEINMDRLSPCKRTVSCSSDDSYCGFGLSKSQRKDFLGNLANFQNLNVSYRDQPQSISREASLNSGEEVRACDKEVEWVTSESDLDRFIPDPYELTNMLSDSDNPFDSDNDRSSEVFIKEFIDNNSHLLAQKSPIKEEVPSALTQLIAENTIYAFGSGLLFGAVDVKNHFQVYAERSDNGCLTVGMYGPRPHCVVETAVNYTGSDIYEITYQVSIPGQYVISVKWADKNIPNSPFICNVE